MEIRPLLETVRSPSPRCVPQTPGSGEAGTGPTETTAWSTGKQTGLRDKHNPRQRKKKCGQGIKTYGYRKNKSEVTGEQKNKFSVKKDRVNEKQSQGQLEPQSQLTDNTPGLWRQECRSGRSDRYYTVNVRHLRKNVTPLYTDCSCTNRLRLAGIQRGTMINRETYHLALKQNKRT